MKSIAVFLLVFLGGLDAHAQLYGAQWMVGYYPISILDFRNDSVIVDTATSLSMYSTLTWANICDETGNLLYCTNGIYIADKNGDSLVNGSGINPCAYTQDYACCGLNIPQAALFLPMPGNSRYYYLFHFSNDDASETRPQTIYYSVIDKQGNGGLGAVIKKNVPILQNIRMREGGMTACKHGNGRDYWIITGGSNDNSFYEFLLTPDSIYGPFKQKIGPIFPDDEDLAYSKFSQDGSKFATGIYEYGPVLIMDFDRCSGYFANPNTILNNSSTTPDTFVAGEAAVEFSSNDSFLYVSTSLNINQYNLYSSNINDSVRIYSSTSDFEPEVNMLQIAINGKLYVSPWEGAQSFLQVINQPDIEGDSCQFIYGGQQIKSLNAVSLPNMINYSLGALIGSGCDTITSACVNTDTSIRAFICQGQNYSFGGSIYSQPGSYSDTLENSGDCDSIINLQLTVLPISHDSVTASICAGQTYTVGTFTHNQTGSYSDTLQNRNGCDSIVSLRLTVDSVTVQVSQPAPDTFIVAGNGNITWLNCDSNRLVEGATSDTFVAKTSGTYAAIVTSGNCSDTSECFTAVVNGIQAISDNQVRIYPNPTGNMLHIILSENTTHTISLYDLNGALLSAFRYEGSSDQLDLSKLSNGVYFIVINANGWSVRRRVVKLD